MINSNIEKEYPFVAITNSVEDYVSPEYYNKLLKEYSFNKETDLDLFKTWLNTIDTPKNILELCSGSGRVSKIALKKFKDSTFTFSDLSNRMLQYIEKNFNSNGKYIRSDAVDYLLKTKEKYDLVYSLWGFSHSVHQHVHKLGYRKAKQKVNYNLCKFINNNISVGGKFYLVHFDSMSDEQKILMRQWRRVYKAFSDISRQSPSKRIIDDTLSKLDDTNKITLKKTHLLGDAIYYKNKKELMEIFLNFHLETYFNKSSLLRYVISDIENLIELYRNKDNSYSIKTGCYIYEITKRSD